MHSKRTIPVGAIVRTIDYWPFHDFCEAKGLRNHHNDIRGSFLNQEAIVTETIQTQEGDVFHKLKDVPGTWPSECVVEQKSTCSCSGCSQILRYPLRVVPITIRCPNCKVEKTIEPVVSKFLLVGHEPAPSSRMTEELTRWDMTINLVIDPEDAGFRVWFACPKCGGIRKLRDLQPDSRRALGEIGMCGYMHTRTHWRSERDEAEGKTNA